ncbi:MAG: VanW family protein [Christensenellaceae bacterium]
MLIALMAFSVYKLPDKALARSRVIVQGKNGDYVLNLDDCFKNIGITDDKKINEFVQGIAKKEKRSASDAHYEYDKKSKRFIKASEKQGYNVNADKLAEDIKSALSVGGGVVCCQYFSVEPKICKDDLNWSITKRARFSTKHSYNSSRDHNIALASGAINGYRLKKGETFSFNGVVGERTKEKGYRESKIILNGNFTEGVGGGVCQVSTTLYNTALLSGLEIVECHRHTLKVNYVEPSFDAMVSGSRCDLKFKNTTGNDVFIISDDIDGVLSFEIYGEKQMSRFFRESSVIEEYLPETKLIKTDKMKSGETNVVSKSKKGCHSKGYLSEYSGGSLISKRLIREDKYMKVDEVIEVGCGD